MCFLDYGCFNCTQNFRVLPWFPHLTCDPAAWTVLLSRQVWGWGQVTGTSGYLALGHQKGRILILQELNGRSGKLNMSLAANGDEGVLRG